jgi:hypothetical protein
MEYVNDKTQSASEPEIEYKAGAIASSTSDSVWYISAPGLYRRIALNIKRKSK